MNMTRQRWFLAAIGAFLIANIAFFVTYRVRYQERLRALDETKQEANRGLDTARRARVEVERQLAGFQQVRDNIDTVHQEHFSTSDRRLPAIITELRSMSSKAGLQLTSISYDVDQQKKELDTVSMSIAFSVVGSYDQIRRLINMIELSEQFVIIDEVSLNNNDLPNQLTMSIRLKTLFYESRSGERGV